MGKKPITKLDKLVTLYRRQRKENNKPLKVNDYIKE